MINSEQVAPTFALAIPHTPWIEERRESLDRLCSALEGSSGGPFRIFDDKEPCHSWFRKILKWGRNTRATHLLQLQDDVLVSENFWSALLAMVDAVPDQVIGLESAHPVFRQLARDEHRWARSCKPAWLVGVGWVAPMSVVRDLDDWIDALPEGMLTDKTDEDELFAEFCTETGRSVFHPIPTIIDHDVAVLSTYNNQHHKLRQPTVTWKEYGPREIEDPEFWKVKGDPPVIVNPHKQMCWGCQNEPAVMEFGETGARMGVKCLADAASQLIMTLGKLTKKI